MQNEKELQFQQYKAQFQRMQQQQLDKELSDDYLEKVAGGFDFKELFDTIAPIVKPLID